MKNTLTLLLHDLGISRSTLHWLYQNADKQMYYDVLHNPNKPAILSDKDREILADVEKVQTRVSSIAYPNYSKNIKYACRFESHYMRMMRFHLAS